MKEALTGTFFLLIFFLILLLGAGYYFFLKIQDTQLSDEKKTASDDIRRHAINDLATKISFALGTNAEVSTQLPTEWQQMGTAVEECRLISAHCQIVNDRCYDMSAVSPSFAKLPHDSAYGSLEKSGYAIKNDGQAIWVTSCYAEDSEIIKKINFRK